MALEDVAVVVEFTQADGSVWRRTGECCRCGECCKSGDPFAENQTNPPKPCALLQGPDAQGKYACGDRTNPFYVTSCAVWPSSPVHIEPYPSCSYRFEQVG